MIWTRCVHTKGFFKVHVSGIVASAYGIWAFCFSSFGWAAGRSMASFEEEDRNLYLINTSLLKNDHTERAWKIGEPRAIENPDPPQRNRRSIKLTKSYKDYLLAFPCCSLSFPTPNNPPARPPTPLVTPPSVEPRPPTTSPRPSLPTPSPTPVVRPETRFPVPLPTFPTTLPTGPPTVRPTPDTVPSRVRPCKNVSFHVKIQE
jgi:hypothetical protein